MSGPRPDWEMLNAYVDGELAPGEAARVADAASRDAETAESIALLYRLKGGSHGAFPAAPADLGQAIPPATSRRPRRRLAAVATVVLAACAALFVAVRLSQPLPSAADQMLVSARDLHARWLEADAAHPDDTAPASLAALARFGRLPVVPDLESTGLSLSMAAVFDLAGSRVLQIGYRGHHGCHVSLFAFDGGPAAGRLQDERAGRELVHAWDANDLGYVLLAEGMDRSRFGMIAAKIEQATRERSPLSAHDQKQLAENWRNSTRCQA